MSVLLAVDDDPLILECYHLAFSRQEATVVTARTAREAIELFARQPPDAALLDVRLPDASGLDAFREMQAIDARVPVILVTGHGTAETAIEAMRLGAYDYLTKPLDPNRLVELVRRAFALSRLVRIPAVLPPAGAEEDRADVLIGQCPAMQLVYKSIGRVAPQDVTVLITGESGTGKELVARAIYHYSRRASGRFLAINCAAIPEALLESELFGHEKGAFTGADRRRIGKFEQAHEGTLFLDEIGDMTPLTQTKILRVLQDQTFERVGGNESIRCNVRLIAATNRDLERMMGEGRFRGDLYYRLNVYRIELPSLRERAGDVPLLAEHYLRRFSQELGKPVTRVAPEALALLERYHWPGNVRELQAAIKQAIIQATGPVLMPEFLPANIQGKEATPSPLADLRQRILDRLQAGASELHAEILGEVEKLLLAEVMRHTAGNLSQASRILGIARPTLRSKLIGFGLYEDRGEE
jgi:two-component system nitrogen regulation response regulator GlnG